MDITGPNGLALGGGVGWNGGGRAGGRARVATGLLCLGLEWTKAETLDMMIASLSPLMFLFAYREVARVGLPSENL